MSCEFRRVKLRDIGRIVTGTTPPTSVPGVFGGAIPFVTPSDMDGRKIITSTERTLSERGFAYVQRQLIPENAVMVSCIGTHMGKVAMAGAPCVTNQQINSIICGPEVDPHYLYYALLTRRGWLQTLSRGGSAIPILNKTQFAQVTIDLPPYPWQRAVVECLNPLDDQIALLSTLNETLESLAKTVFEAWFVKFDPVRAKAEGRDPEGMDEDIAALFPCQFEESGKGLIPKGWRIRTLDSIASYLNGLALQKYPPVSEDQSLPVIKIKQLKAGNTEGADRSSNTIPPDYVVQDGDVLFSWSGSLEVEIWCGGPGALNQHIFKVTSNEVPKWYYYLAIKQFLPMFREIAASKATTMGHIQRHHLKEAKIALPPPELLRRANAIMEPLIERRILNSLLARQLSELRDTLLPRLISGKLRVPEAEEALKEVL